MRKLNRSLPKVPASAGDGQIMHYAARYAGDVVMAVFDQIGGADAMAEWAEENRGEFYTKMFTKTIVRQTEVRDADKIGTLLKQLDDDIVELDVEDCE